LPLRVAGWSIVATDDLQRANLRAERLGREVRTRLAELQVSGRTLSEAGYIPRGNLQRLTSGTSVPRDLTGLDRGLGWEPGSAEMAGAGGRPKPALVPRGQSRTAPGQVEIDWPRPDGDWRTAIEEAWERHATLPSETEPSVLIGGNPGTVEQDVRAWLAPRVQGLPVWLAERIQTVLTEASQQGERRPDPLVLADRIIPLNHSREILALLIDWSRAHP